MRRAVGKKFTAFTMAVVMLLFSCACSRTTSTQDTQFAMDTVMTYTVYGNGGEQAVTDTEELMTTIENTLSVTVEGSEIYAYNSGDTDALSDETGDLLSYAYELEKMTDGAFVPDLGALTMLWGFSTGDPKLPTQEEIDAVLNDRSLIDLGGIAKGYASEKIRELWIQEGITSGIASLGGNVMMLGTKPDGSLWTVGVRDPFGTETDLIGTLKVSDTMVVTSGSYERTFEQDGKTYHHILNPETGYPVDNGLVGVTVICQDGIKADALSTGLFVMGKEKALEFWKNSDDIELILVEENGTVTVTEGIWDVFTSVEGYTYEKAER